MMLRSFYLSLLAFGLVQGGWGAGIHGRLVDGTGRPIVGAKISASAYKLGTGVPPKILTTLSDGKGVFTFAEVPEAPTKDCPFQFMAKLPGGSLAIGQLNGDGEDVRLAENSGTIRVLAVDSSGRPIQGAKVGIRQAITKTYRSRSGWSFTPDWYLGVDAKGTDSHGVTEIRGMPRPGPVWFELRAPGFTKKERFTTVVAKGASEEKITLTRAGRLSGKVLKDGTGAPGVRVSAVVSGAIANYWISDTTDAQGEYRIEGVPPGPVELIAELKNPIPGFLIKKLKGGPLPEGGELGGLNLAIEKGITVSGHVLTVETDKPIPKALVTVFGADGSRSDMTTGADGRFEATVAEGDESVLVGEIDGKTLTHPAQLSVKVNAATNPPLEIRVPVVFTYPPIAHLEGVVLDSTGKPVPAAQAVDLCTQERATADGRGRFRFESASNPADLVIAVKGDSMSTQAVELSDQKSISLKLDGKAASLQGTILDEAAKPMEGIQVTLGAHSRTGYISFPSVMTDSTGTYRFAGLFGGLKDFFLWAKEKGYGGVTIQPIQLQVGQNTPLETLYMMKADGTIDGHVYEVDGKPAKGARVTAQCQESEPVMTDDNGAFHLTSVPRGGHFIATGRGNSESVAVQAKTGDKDVVLRLPKPTEEPVGIVFQDMAGHAAPPLTVKEWVNSKALGPDAWKGKILVLDFWAVSCRPCVKSLPDVQALSKRYGSKGVVVIGIHMPGTPKAKVAEMLAQKRVTYPNAIDENEKYGLGVTHSAFGPMGIPHMFVIDPKGRIMVDTHDVEDVELAVKTLIAAQAKG